MCEGGGGKGLEEIVGRGETPEANHMSWVYDFIKLTNQNQKFLIRLNLESIRLCVFKCINFTNPDNNKTNKNY